jgi:ATP-dependent Clp protease ATP-binding subunit ClpA
LKYSFSSNIKNLSSKLKSNIFGQDHVIDEVIDILKINYSGLGDDKKPIGSFLFVGSTGVGKTELEI